MSVQVVIDFLKKENIRKYLAQWDAETNGAFDLYKEIDCDGVFQVEKIVEDDEHKITATTDRWPYLKRRILKTCLGLFGKIPLEVRDDIAYYDLLDGDGWTVLCLPVGRAQFDLPLCFLTMKK